MQLADFLAERGKIESMPGPSIAQEMNVTCQARFFFSFLSLTNSLQNISYSLHLFSRNYPLVGIHFVGCFFFFCVHITPPAIILFSLICYLFYVLFSFVISPVLHSIFFYIYFHSHLRYYCRHLILFFMLLLLNIMFPLKKNIFFFMFP